MKASIAAVALALAVSAPVFAQQESSKPAPWLVAQNDRRMPSCKHDDSDRNVPVGTTICREGKTQVCKGNGTWQATTKPC